MNFLGDENRRCLSCKTKLLKNHDVRWKQGVRDWRKWELWIWCCACEKWVAQVAKSNMPEDESLIPKKPDIAGQKELFSDAGSKDQQDRDYYAV